MAATSDVVAWARRVGIERLLDAFGDVLPEAAVYAVDGSRRLVFWSEGAERLLGFTAADVLGEHCLKASRCDQCLHGCGVAEHGTVEDVPLTVYTANGEARPVRKDARAFFDGSGAFLGAVEVLRSAPAVEERLAAPQAATGVRNFHGLISGAPEMHATFDTIARVAETEVPVLVRGESGTGKELVARALHDLGPRKGAAFVAVNCAALTPSLLEAELFGHVRGAFTGAVRDHEGLFAQADGGTLFLDEIAELPLEVQAKLLRGLESGEVVPVGAGKARRVDVRVIAATHESLREAVREGRFREDLMYRLRVVPLFLPPLRARSGDVPVLLDFFIAEHNARGPRRMLGVAPDAMRSLLEHRWPGNVRELKNVIAYAFAVGGGPRITRADLPPELREPRAALAPSLPLDADEPTRIEAALAATGGRVGEAAEILGMSRPTFWRKRKQHKL